MKLSDTQLARLQAAPTRVCPTCKQETATDYCRTCDDFFENGHTSECDHRSEHSDHEHYGRPG